jgi:hypothetical protein
MAKREATASARQEKWFQSVADGIERDTGQSLDAWVKLAKTCPETGHRARLKWLKDEHGLGQNRASTILALAFPDPLAWDRPDALLDHLFTQETARDLYDAVAAMAGDLDNVTIAPRKQFVGFSNKVQFAAIMPTKAGGVRIGLALPVDEGRITVKKSEPWSDRLQSVVELAPGQTPPKSLAALLKRAHAAS